MHILVDFSQCLVRLDSVDLALLWDVSPFGWIHWNSVVAFASEYESLLSACGMASWGVYRTFDESVSIVAG